MRLALRAALEWRKGATGGSGVRTLATSSTLSTAQQVGSESAAKPARGGVLPWALAVAGMIPFAALTPIGAEALGSVDELKDVPGLGCVLARSSELQRTYAATIVSFLGAIHWGTALAQPPVGGSPARFVSLRYLWGVSPSLLAWGSLALPEVWCYCGMIGSLLSCYAVDRAAVKRNLLPNWYLPIRTSATTVATLSLGCSLYLAWSKTAQRTTRRPSRGKAGAKALIEEEEAGGRRGEDL